MAWTQCKWCEKKLNGYGNMTTHTRNIHPKEHARSTLVWAIQQSQTSVAYHSQQLAERVEYERFLTGHLDYPLVRKAVESQLKDLNYSVERIQEYLAYAQRDLDKAQAALIAFDVSQYRASLTS